MKYKALIPMAYDGNLYEVGKIVDILEKETAKNCLERKLIAEITEDEIPDSIVDEDKTNDSGISTDVDSKSDDEKAEDTETDSEKTAEEKTIEVENEEQKNDNKSNKTGKIKNK